MKDYPGLNYRYETVSHLHVRNDSCPSRTEELSICLAPAEEPSPTRPRCLKQSRTVPLPIVLYCALIISLMRINGYTHGISIPKGTRNA